MAGPHDDLDPARGILTWAAIGAMLWALAILAYRCSGHAGG
jgi:hypothetical protein